MYLAVAGDLAEQADMYPKWNESRGIAEHKAVEFGFMDPFCKVSIFLCGILD